MKPWLFNGLLIAAGILASYSLIRDLPDRIPLVERTTALRYVPVALSAAQPPLRLAGAWSLDTADPRLDGVSALAIDRGRFVAVTDFGVALRFDPPSAANPIVRLADLPSGPGPADQKAWRDSEGLARDPSGRGWWVSFETRHQLRLFDPTFSRTLAIVPLGGHDWRKNGGAEGLATVGTTIVVAAEDGVSLTRFDGRRFERLPYASAGRIGDIAALPDGRLLLLARTLGPLGFRSGLFVHDIASGRTRPLARLPLGHLDNAEGLAVQSLPGGTIRIWVICDRDSRARGRTLLAAFDWKP